MTFVPDSVLVEKVAKARYANLAGIVRPWAELGAHERAAYIEGARQYVSVACPLVAGVIADRLDERYAERSGDDSHSTMSDWDFARRDGLVDAAALVRSEFVDGEA